MKKTAKKRKKSVEPGKVYCQTVSRFFEPKSRFPPLRHYYCYYYDIIPSFILDNSQAEVENNIL